jgi:SAM-dependent methyltransferase
VATGQTTQLLSQFGEVVSVEYDLECCEFLRNELQLEVINASITKRPFENDSFDLVCPFDVIEHVDGDDKGVEEMVRVCCEEGLVFVTVHAFMDLWSNHDDINHHKRRYIKSQLKELFKDHQGRVVTASYFNALLFPLIYLVRKLMNSFPGLSKRESGDSDFELMNNRITNTLLYCIFAIERSLIRYIGFPFGVSILLMFNKAGNESSKT